MIIQRMINKTTFGLYWNMNLHRFANNRSRRPNDGKRIIEKIKSARNVPDLWKLRDFKGKQFGTTEYAEFCEALKAKTVGFRGHSSHWRKLAIDLADLQLQNSSANQLKKFFYIYRIIEVQNIRISGHLMRKFSHRILDLLADPGTVYQRGDLLSIYHFFVRTEVMNKLDTVLHLFMKQIENPITKKIQNVDPNEFIYFFRVFNKRPTANPEQIKVFKALLNYTEQNLSNFTNIEKIKIYKLISGTNYSVNDMEKPELLNKIEDELRNNMDKLTEKQIFTLLSRFNSGHNLEIIQELFQYIMESIDEDGYSSINSVTLLKLFSSIAWYRSLRNEDEQITNKYMLFIERALTKEFSSQMVSPFLTICDDQFYSLKQIQRIEEIDNKAVRFQNHPDYLYRLSKFDILTETHAERVFMQLSKSKIINKPKYSVMISYLRKKYPKNQRFRRQYKAIQSYWKDLRNTHYLFLMFEGLARTTLMKDFHHEFGELFINQLIDQLIVEDSPELDEGESEYAQFVPKKKFIEQTLLSYLVMCDCTKQLRKIMKLNPSAITPFHIRSLLIGVLEDTTRFWIGCEKTINMLLLEYRTELMKIGYTIRVVLDFLTNKVILDNISSSEIPLHFQVIYMYIKNWQHPTINEKLFLKVFLFNDNKHLQYHPEYPKLMKKILTLENTNIWVSRKLTHIMLQTIMRHNMMTKKIATNFLKHSDNFNSFQMQVYSRIILNDEKSVLLALEKKQNIVFQVLFLYTRWPGKNFDIIDRNIEKMFSIIISMNPFYVELTLNNFMMPRSQGSNSLFPILIKKYCDSLDKKLDYLEPYVLLETTLKHINQRRKQDVLLLFHSIQKYYSTWSLMENSYIEGHVAIMKMNCYFNKLIPEYKHNLEQYLENTLKKEPYSIEKRQAALEIYEILALGGEQIENRNALSLLLKDLNFFIHDEKKSNLFWKLIFYIHESFPISSKILQRGINKFIKADGSIPKTLLSYFRIRFPNIQSIESIRENKLYTQKQEKVQKFYISFMKQIAFEYDIPIQVEQRQGMVLLQVNELFIGFINEHLSSHSKNLWNDLYESLFKKGDLFIEFVSLKKQPEQIVQFLCENIPQIIGKNKNILFFLNKMTHLDESEEENLVQGEADDEVEREIDYLNPQEDLHYDEKEANWFEEYVDDEQFSQIQGNLKRKENEKL